MPKEGSPSILERERRHEGFEYAVRTRAARKHPSRNEDVAVEIEDHDTVGLFDGMGGHASGDLASTAAAEGFGRYVVGWEPFEDETVEQDVIGELKSALRFAAKKVQQVGDEAFLNLKTPEEKKKFRRPGTTAVVAKLHAFEDGRKKAFIVSVGDSRAYLWRPDEGLLQITEDDDILSNIDYRHSLEAEFGRDISEEDIQKYRTALNSVPSEDRMPDRLGRYLFQARNVIARSLSRTDALHHYVVDMEEGDVLLLTTDGVHDNLAHERMADILANASSPQEAVERLTSEAYEYAGLALKEQKKEGPKRRSKDDDITALAVAPRHSS